MSVIASEAKQSSSRAEGLHCFVATRLAMTTTSKRKTPGRDHIPPRRLHFTFAITPR
jgi:hypothetical protein